MFLHSFRIYKWPPNLIKNITSRIKNFLWSGDVDKAKCVTLSWSNVCKPKLEGGLGLRDLKQLNAAALLKISWDSLKSNTDWGSLFRSRFKVTSFQFSTAYMKSAIWPGIKEALPIIFLHCRWIVGNGKMVNFWLDRWVLNPIASVLDISSIQTHLKGSVSNVIRNQRWHLPSGFEGPSIAADIKSLALPILPYDDSLIWEPSKDGTLSFGDCFALFDELSPRNSINMEIVYSPKTIHSGLENFSLETSYG